MTPAQYNEYERQAQVIERHEKWKEQQNKAEISDEEIESASVLKYGGDNFAQQRANIDKILAFEEGAKWYREQLKNIDKKL